MLSNSQFFLPRRTTAKGYFKFAILKGKTENIYDQLSILCTLRLGWLNTIFGHQSQEKREKSAELWLEDSSRQEVKEGFLREQENISFATGGREEPRRASCENHDLMVCAGI